jgi:hypothetical protein
MHDEAPHPTCKARGKIPDDPAVPWVEDVHAAVEVHHRQKGLRRRKIENVFKLAWRPGIDLGCQSGLGKSARGEVKERVIAINSLLE